MAGIFGAFRRASYDLQHAEASLSTTSKQGFDQQPRSVSNSKAFIGITTRANATRSSVLQSREGEHTLVILGDLYLPDGSALDASSFESKFLRQFIEQREEFLGRTDGAFAFALLSEQELILATDPFGTLAVHYSDSSDAFVFSSQMRGVCKAIGKTEWDDAGLEQYLGLGMTLNGSTPFRNVRGLPNASMLSANADGIAIKKYFRPQYAPGDTSSVLKALGGAFERSVAVRAKSPNLIAALTGGFDSRATWSVLQRNHNPTEAHTHGLPDCRDLTVARKIKSSLNISGDEFLFTSDLLNQLPDRWQQFVRLTEGAIPIEHTPTMMVFAHLAPRFSTLMDSYGGAFYRRQRMKVAELRIDAQQDIIPQLWKYEQSALVGSGFLRTEPQREIEAASKNALRAYYDTITDTKLLGDKLDLFHFEQIDAMKDSLANGMQINYVGISHPFMNREGIQLAAQLPIKARRSDAFHKYAIARFFPELANFWMDNVGYAAPYRGFSTLRYVPMIADRILTKLGLPTLRRPTMDLSHLLAPFMTRVREIVLDPHPVYDRYVDREEVERAITTDAMQHATALMQLVTFRLFVEAV